MAPPASGTGALVICFLKGQNDIPMSKSLNGKSSNTIYVYDIYVDAAVSYLDFMGFSITSKIAPQLGRLLGTNCPEHLSINAISHRQNLINSYLIDSLHIGSKLRAYVYGDSIALDKKSHFDVTYWPTLVQFWIILHIETEKKHIWNSLTNVTCTVM